MVNKWKEVFDFTPSAEGNYKLIDTAEFEIINFSTIADEFNLGQDVRDLVTDSDFLYELPVEFGGTLDQATIDAQKKEHGGMKAFDIKQGPGVASN